MTEITCEICMDLMPLVQDGIASEDSRKAVEAHITKCTECKALFMGTPPEPQNAKTLVKKIQRKIHVFCGVLLLFGIFFGIGLTASEGQFYNVLVMPVIGALGYYIFRWKTFYIVPCLLFVTHLLSHITAFLRGAESVAFSGMVVTNVLWWTVVYCAFVWIGSLIAALLHFALKKEDFHE